MTPMSAKPTGRRPGPAADPDQRGELLAAASRLLATEGPGALTVRRIASEAGYSTMGVYSRFGGKDGIVEALFVEGFEGLTAAMEAVPPGPDAEADLVACGVAYRRYSLEHPTSYAIMFERAVPSYEPSLDAAIVAYRTFEHFVHKVTAAIEAGFLPPDDPAAIAQRLWAMSHGWVSLEIHGMLTAETGEEAYVRALYSLYPTMPSGDRSMLNGSTTNGAASASPGGPDPG
jgi:AcrR family transcriptional regulator